MKVVCYIVIKNSLHTNLQTNWQNFNLLIGHLNKNICIKLHIFAQFVPLNKTEVVFHTLKKMLRSKLTAFIQIKNNI